MSSLQQPARKRSRFESNTSISSEIIAKSNTNINLLSLPDEALNNIISYSMPQKECQVWEWIGILSHVCRSFRRFAQTYAPTRIVLKDFISYCQIIKSFNTIRVDFSDVRVGFLRSLRDCSWKRQHITEFHVNAKSVLRERERRDGEDPIPRAYRMCECNDIKTLLRTLLTTQASFAELEWLDIELQSDDVYHYDLINAETLHLMPDALPALHKLCLCKCFKDGIREISPYRLKRFFSCLQTPLSFLSICGPLWMTDAHIEAIIPIIGENLVRFELVDCLAYDEHTDVETKLSCNSLVPIAQHCKQLKSFSMVGSHITCSGLERVLSANTGITTLNLSDSSRLEPRAIDIISRYLPRLEVLRNYWPNRTTDWLSDDGLIALIDAQEKERVVRVSFSI